MPSPRTPLVNNIFRSSLKRYIKNEKHVIPPHCTALPGAPTALPLQLTAPVPHDLGNDNQNIGSSPLGQDLTITKT